MPLTDGKYISTVTLEGGAGKLNYGNFYTMLNTPIEIHTVAVNGINGTHYAEAGQAVTILDTVTLNGTDTERPVNSQAEWDFIKYRLVTQVKVAGTGEPVPLKNANDETGTRICKNFVTEDFNGHIEVVELQIEDTAAYEGKTLYVSEELYTYVTKSGHEGNRDEAVLIACEDESIFPDVPEELKETQRIHFPYIATTLTEDEGQAHTANASCPLSLTDTVFYKNLIKGKEYVIRGVLMSRATGKPATDADGHEIKAEKSFKADAGEGTVDITFSFTNPDFSGDTLVAFEELFENDIRIGAHEDINDENQSVHLPSVGTVLTRNDGSKIFQKTENLILEDEVRLNNIEPGITYLLKGYLVNQKTGKYLLQDGSETGNLKEAYAVSTEFLARDTEALLHVSFAIDASKINFDIVCYELYEIEQDEA